MASHQLEKRRGGASVSFGSARVYLVPHHTDFSGEEHSAIWLTSSDLRGMQSDVVRIVKMIRLADRDGVPVPDTVVCQRGIEQLRSAARMERRKMNQVLCRASLYREQARQRALGIVDEEALARASAVGSRRAREVALEMGARDEAEARKLRNPARRYHPHISHQPAMPIVNAGSTGSIPEQAMELRGAPTTWKPKSNDQPQSVATIVPTGKRSPEGLDLPQLRAEIAPQLRGPKKRRTLATAAA